MITAVCLASKRAINCGNNSSARPSMNSPFTQLRFSALRTAALMACRSTSTPTNFSTVPASSMPNRPTPQYASTT